MLYFCINTFLILSSCLMLCYMDDLLFSAAPSEPMNFNLLPNTSSSLSANWEVPARPNGIILGYTISCTTAPTTAIPTFSVPARLNGIILGYTTPCTIPPTTAIPITFSVPGSVLSHLLMGLEPFTNYTCEVRANTSAGGGDSSNTETERTDEDGKDIEKFIIYSEKETVFLIWSCCFDGTLHR